MEKNNLIYSEYLGYVDMVSFKEVVDFFGIESVNWNAYGTHEND